MAGSEKEAKPANANAVAIWRPAGNRRGVDMFVLTHDKLLGI